MYYRPDDEKTAISVFLLFAMLLSMLMSKGAFAAPSNLKGDRLITQVRGVALVVPIYRELDNGNLHRFLESVYELNVNRSEGPEFVLMFVVNNSREEGLPGYFDSSAYEENQRTILFLREEAKKHNGLQIQVIDHSTVGPGDADKTVFPTRASRNIGLIRHLGVMEVLKTYTNIISEYYWIIGMMDADAVLDPNWFLKVEEAFSDGNIGAGLATINWFIPPGSSLDVIRSSAQALIPYRIHQLTNALRFGGELPWGGCTPRILARATVYAEYGGFSRLPYAEDWNFIDYLRHCDFVVATLPDVKVAVSDRARPDGYDAAERFAGLQTLSGKNQGFRLTTEVEEFIQQLLNDREPIIRVKSIKNLEPNALARERRVFVKIVQQALFRGDKTAPRTLTMSLDRFLDGLLHQFLTPPELALFRKALADETLARRVEMLKNRASLKAIFLRLSDGQLRNTVSQQQWSAGWQLFRQKYQEKKLDLGLWVNLTFTLPEADFQSLIDSMPRQYDRALDYLAKKDSDFFTMNHRTYLLDYLRVLTMTINRSHRYPQDWPGLQAMVYALSGEVMPPAEVQIDCSKLLSKETQER